MQHGLVQVGVPQVGRMAAGGRGRLAWLVHCAQELARHGVQEGDRQGKGGPRKSWPRVRKKATCAGSMP